MNLSYLIRNALVALLALALVSSIGCSDDDDVENGDPDLGDVHSLELIDRDDDAVTAYVHDDHWHGSPFTLHVGEDRRSIGFRFLDSADEEVDIPLGDDGWSIEVDATNTDVIDINHHGDHVHLTGVEDGATDLLFDLEKDGETIYAAPALSTVVHAADAEDYETIADVELIDRSDESVLVYSDGDHWHGGIDLDAHACSHESLGFRFLDPDGDEVHIPMGSDGFDYEISGYDSDLIYLNTHSDHFHLQGEMEGHTDLEIEFTKDGDVFYDAAQGDDLHVDIDAEGYQHVTEVDLLDRNDNDEVLVYSDGDHWHGSLELDVDAAEHESIGFRLLDDMDEEVCVPLGDHGFSYDIHGYDADIIYLDPHSDHFHIQGEQVGHTDLHIEFTRDGDVFYDAADGDHLHVDVVD